MPAARGPARSAAVGQPPRARAGRPRRPSARPPPPRRAAPGRRGTAAARAPSGRARGRCCAGGLDPAAVVEAHGGHGRPREAPGAQVGPAEHVRHVHQLPLDALAVEHRQPGAHRVRARDPVDHGASRRDPSWACVRDVQYLRACKQLLRRRKHLPTTTCTLSLRRDAPPAGRTPGGTSSRRSSGWGCPSPRSRRLMLMSDREPETLKAHQRGAGPLPPRREPRGRRPAQARDGQARGGPGRPPRQARVADRQGPADRGGPRWSCGSPACARFVDGLEPRRARGARARARPLAGAPGDRAADPGGTR